MFFLEISTTSLMLLDGYRIMSINISPGTPFPSQMEN